MVIQWDLMGLNGIEWDSMVIQWWFNGDSMDLMGFNSDSMGFNGIEWDSMVIQ